MGMGLGEAAAVEEVLVAGAGLEGECVWCALGVEELWGVAVSGLAEMKGRFRDAISRLVRRGFGRMVVL